MHEDPFDVSLTDDELMAEVELLTQVIIAATESEARLTLDQIDAVLGVGQPGDEADPGEDPAPSGAGQA